MKSLNDVTQQQYCLVPQGGLKTEVSGLNCLPETNVTQGSSTGKSTQFWLQIHIKYASANLS